jgi:hypothetical protein
VLTPEIDGGEEFVGTPIIDSGVEPVEPAKSVSPEYTAVIV